MDNNIISFRRDKIFLTAGHHLFVWLHKLNLDEKFVADGPEWNTTRAPKRPHEIIDLGFDRSCVEKKFFKWFFCEDEVFELTHDEFRTFIKCVEAGNYYLDEFNYNHQKGEALIRWLKDYLSQRAGNKL